MIYSKCCPCGGDIEINTDTEGKYHLTCIQCSREISKEEALGSVSYTHLRAHETKANRVRRGVLGKK